MPGAAPPPAGGRLRRWVGRLRWPLTVLLVVLAVLFLRKNLSWSDRYVLDGPPAVVGVELLAGPPAQLLTEEGSRVELSVEQAAAVRRVRGLASTFAAASPWAVVVALLMYAISFAAVAVRWRSLIFLLGGGKLPLGPALRITTEAAGLSLVLPGTVTGDVYRMGWMLSRGVPARVATLSVALDRLAGLWMLVLLASLVAPASTLSAGFKYLPVLPFVLLGGAAAVVLGLLFLPVARAPARLRDALLVTRNALRGHPSQLVVVVGCSAANMLAQVAGFLLVLRTFAGSVPPWSELSVGVLLGMLANSLPLAPGGVGVGEAAFVFLLGRCGVASADVLATALTLRVVLYALALLALVGYLRHAHARR